MNLLRLIKRLLLREPRTFRNGHKPRQETTDAALATPRWGYSQQRRETKLNESPAAASPQLAPAASIIKGQCWVIDGDTIVIDKVHVRLAGIDAPELDHPWGQRSKWRLVELCKGRIITAQVRPELSYDRMVAQCFLPDGRDLSAEMVKCGMALDWAKFSGGRYRELEPPGARKKLWRAEARQRGRAIPPISSC